MPNNNFFGKDYVDSKRIIYTPSAFARKNLFYLQEIGTLNALIKHKNVRDNLDSFLFFTVKKGSGVLNYDGVEYALTSGDSVFIDCSKPYFHETSDDLWSLVWVHFSGEKMPQIYENYIEMGGKPCFTLKNATEIHSIFKSLWQKADSDSRFRDVEINECISSLLTNICNEGVPVQDNVSVYRRDVQEIANYISENFRNKISLDELSQRFFINKYYLTRVFKEQFGITINQYITAIRITEAKRALRFSDESVENIGYNCGLDAPHYFSRTFKRVEGISPSEFRKKWQRK